MMGSREAVVDYMTPLGLAHLMGTGHHYGPAPWVNDLGRADWNPTYYHRADASGIGFDRGVKGSNAISQYSPEVAKQFGYAGYGIREVNVSTDSPPIGVQPMARGGMMMAKADSAEALPIEPGKGTVTATVSGSVQLTK